MLVTTSHVVILFYNSVTNESDSLLPFNHDYQISKIKLILCCILTCLGYMVSLLKYVKSVLVKCNKSKFCKFLIRLYRPCLSYTNKAVMLYWPV